MSKGVRTRAKQKSWNPRLRTSFEILARANVTPTEELDRAWDGTEGVYAHFDMDVIGGAGPAPGDILGELVEPIAMTDYEVIRIAHEVGRRGLTGFSFICIPPGSAAVYRVIVSIIVYMAAGLALRKQGKGHG